MIAGAEHFHQPVLRSEVLVALQPCPGGFLALDCTTNGGGHAYALLEASSPDGRVVGLDADASALEVADRRLSPFAGRYQLVHRNFRDLAGVAAELNLGQVDAVLFDLGLSSGQLEASGRGFSFQRDEPLDMRFSRDEPVPTAADLLADLSMDELERVFRDYGEERRAHRLARVIDERRVRAPLVRTTDLVAAVERALGPAHGRIHPATRAFQALRIAVNQELAALEQGLRAAVDILRAGGRLAVISFHSLEDRIVKWRLREWSEHGTDGPPRVRILTKKPLTASESERRANPRARSAKLRVAEKLPAGMGVA